MGIIWTIIIGFIAGMIAKFIMPGPNEPSGFILTTILGIVGAVVATYLGQAVGWYHEGEGAGFIGAIVGAIIVLAIYGFIARRSSAI
ncbi:MULTISPECIES: GlsB/YeaQ/YmgE family stress response membrane protein [Lichenihabitans]|uniref:GlsB/YeaQ/YmgE family stress response membrane protein n=1 Tax=Lichenihabitans TaxID=2723776 RepID=UPI00103657FE|nr:MULTISPECIES: GlsB/YeaQ/YmgE family stress response membrane protein [Lichenihabitans]UDL94326.1 GlsB/YeaQ/YmgE family stress response membrane protein [Lichenihabitans sp. PAMC28606]